MTHAELWDGLNEVFRDVMDVPDLKVAESTTANDVEEWDSITHVLLIVAVRKNSRSNSPQRRSNPCRMWGSWPHWLSKIAVTGAGLLLHHVGCLVESIEIAAAEYEATQSGTPAGPSTWISSQRARVLFVSLAPGIFVELVQPDSDNRFLNRLLRRGVTFYHFGSLCSNMKAAELAFAAEGARELTRFSSEAFEGRQCSFFLTATGQMIELIETPSQAAEILPIS